MSHLAFIAPERSCSPQWCGEAFSPQTAIQPLAFSGPRYAEFYLGADSAAAWGARGDKEQPHPTPAFAPSQLPSGPAAISRRRAAPSALRLVPLVDSGAGVRLHATFGLARGAVTLGGGAWPGEAGPRGGVAAAVALGRRRVMAVAMGSAFLLLLALLGPAAALAGYIEVCGGCGGGRRGLPRGT